HRGVGVAVVAAVPLVVRVAGGIGHGVVRQRAEVGTEGPADGDPGDVLHVDAARGLGRDDAHRRVLVGRAEHAAVAVVVDVVVGEDICGSLDDVQRVRAVDVRVHVFREVAACRPVRLDEQLHDARHRVAALVPDRPGDRPEDPKGKVPGGRGTGLEVRVGDVVLTR